MTKDDETTGRDAKTRQKAMTGRDAAGHGGAAVDVSGTADDRAGDPTSAGGELKPPRAAEILPLRSRRPCPICGRDSQRDAYPFCSKRCKDIDLNRWLSGGYAIPAVETEESGEDDEG